MRRNKPTLPQARANMAATQAQQRAHEANRRRRMTDVPIAPTDTCPDCGRGTAMILTADGAGTFHVGPYDPETNTQHVAEHCNDGWAWATLTKETS